MMRLVVLDRDGVINEDSPDYIRSPEAFRPIEGSFEAIARFTQAGLLVAVATNQSGLARGLFDMDVLNRIHALLCSRATAVGGRIDLIAFCPHGPDDACHCRKPAPGLLECLSGRLSVPPQDMVMIGDSLRDLRAAELAGVRPVLVRTGNGCETANALTPSLSGVAVYEDLRAAADGLLGPER
jgi:D-glycero-D-manno-heptose 1,7-bisphosphate phosphatase